MADAIIDGTNIDTNVFSYSAPKAHASGGKVVNLYNKHFKESLTISTPLMLTWGAQEGQEQGTGKPTGKWTMALQFPNAEYTNPDAEAFLRSIKALEQKVKTDAMTYSKEWFGKEIKSAEVIDEKFNVMLRHPKKSKGSVEVDETKPPTLTVKIPQWSGVWKPEIYDEDGEPLYINGKVNSHLSPLEYLKPKTHVICLLQCGGLWFVNGKISITWNLKQAIVQKPKQSMEGTCFLKPKASDKEKMKALPPPDEDIDPDGAQGTAIVADSDDERDLHETISVPLATTAVDVVVSTSVNEKVDEPVTEEVKPKKKIIRKKSDA
ncbi:hypothetical protein EB001_27565 [bacterium]|nr:hypothetical protein [bacterium]